MKKLLKIPYIIIDRLIQKLIPKYKKLRKYEQELKYWKDVLPSYLSIEYYRNYPDALHIDINHFNNKRILDVGCGPLGAINEFKNCEKFGIDPLIHDYNIIGYPLWKHDITYLNCYSEKMPFTTGFFDAVIAVNSLDHVDDFFKTAKEIIRITKSGGEIIFQVEYHKPWNTEPQEINDIIILQAFFGCHMENVKSYFGTGKYKNVEYATWHGRKYI